MTLTVDLCGRLAEPLGPQLIIDDCSAIHCVADLREAIASAHPVLAAQIMSQRVRACIDNEIVRDTALVGPGAIVAFFPPLSGG